MIRRRPPACLDEAAARDVLLLQAFEAIDPPSPSWTADDAAWATRVARETEGALPAAGRSTEAFLATRAAVSLQRLLAREPALAAVRQPGAARGRRVGLSVAVAVGAIVGLGADAIGSSQRINLLAPPVWTVVLWNLAVYLLLVGAAARRAFGNAPDGPGLFIRSVERLTALGRRWPWRGEAHAGARPARPGSTAAALQFFAVRWAAVVAPLAASRAAVLLHAAAAALGAGLVVGLYARGLVLDYRVAWESTFLSPTDVHAALATLLAPASLVSGIALPDLAAVTALRAAHGDVAVGAPAAPWIHLYAWTLAIAVVLPRAGLAAFGAARSRHAAGHFRLALDGAYFHRLDFARRGEVVRVVLCPYAQPPTALALAAIRARLAEVCGGALELNVAPTIPFGGEDDGGAMPGLAESPGATVVVALFDLAATPEPEHQGRFVGMLAGRASAARATAVALVDETAFRRRFGAVGPRLAERRAAWSRLLAGLGATPVFADLEASDDATAVAALRSAFGVPARPPR